MPEHSGRIKLDVSVAVIVQDQSVTTVLPAQTVDASPFGARIKDFFGNVHVGQKVTLIYGEKQCAFRVAWVGSCGTQWSGHVGMECLEQSRNFWNINFHDAEIFSVDALTFPWEASQAS